METMDFDVVVVGGGHAGCEAAAVAARMGRRAALITLSTAGLGQLSCNPAIGGLAKGHLVRELDALGGLMGRVADATTIQFRRLNTRRGLAVQSSRAQVDIARYPLEMARRLRAVRALSIVEAEVADLLVDRGRAHGGQLASGESVLAPAVVLTTGTFLAAVLHRGGEQTPGGRLGDAAAGALAASLKRLGLRCGRLKTGTVPRLDGRTIDWERLEPQTDTVPYGRFSFGPPGPRPAQIVCRHAYTNATTHRIIADNLHRSPMFSGAIVGRGPRYCPSVEDKIARFPDRDRHLLFLEPEGLETDRVYVNGLSTSLPADVQEAVVHSIEGLEQARVVQYGYAVEYDFADPTQLGPDLQHRDIPGLYLAGQVNGTSGYEEAAAQGFVAGASAALGAPFHVERAEGYVGVLIDDLVTRGVGGEPYRMFSSRAEHRLLLREDNADRRLMPRGRALGLIDDATWHRFEAHLAAIDQARTTLEATAVNPSPQVLALLDAHGLGSLRQPTTAAELLRRPEATWERVWHAFDLPDLPARALEQVEIDIKYEGYVARAERRASQARRMEAVRIPPATDWSALQGLSTEVRERLGKARPETLGQVSRTPGVTAAAVHAIAAWLSRASAAS